MDGETFETETETGGRDGDRSDYNDQYRLTVSTWINNQNQLNDNFYFTESDDFPIEHDATSEAGKVVHSL